MNDRKQARTYIVFEQTTNIGGDQGGWVEIERVESGAAGDAIRKIVKELSDPTGTYVAVTERSFQPMTVSTETKNVTRLAIA